VKIVVIGGTGLVGSKLTDLLRRRVPVVVAASRKTGVNTVTGAGLSQAIAGAQVVVDVTNSSSIEDKAAMDFFVTSTRNLLAAEATAGVRHHVALSVIGAQRVVGSGYLGAKAVQEALIKHSSTPYTILESTQFFEFLDFITDRALDGEVYRASPAMIQPVASDDVVEALADIALASPRNGTIEIAGPEAFSLDELVRQVLVSRQDPRQIRTDAHARYFGAELGNQSLIPGPAARIGSVTLRDWLQQFITAD
jgi:uncharacterized protein YbjT (DUF2867 family)